MKIAIVCTLMKRFGAKGFYNSQEIGLGRALAKMGHEVTIYKGVKTKEEEEKGIQVQDGLTIHYLKIPRFGGHGYMPTGVLDKSCDAMLCFADNQIFIPHIYKFCQENNIVFVPYVGTTFSLYGDSLHAEIMNWLFSKTTQEVYWQTRILAKTDTAKQELMRLGVDEDKITVAHVGLDKEVLHTTFMHEDKTAIRQKYGYTENDVIICNVARLDADKRTIELLHVLDHIRDKKPFKLLIVGKGAFRSQIDAEIEKCGLGDIVTILDQVPYQDMWEVYTMSDYYVNMSKTEIFGMAIMEAIYYNTSVAAINALGPSIILKDMPGHKLCMSDEEVEEWLIGEAPSTADLKKSSKKLIREFSWDACAKAFLATADRQRKTDEKIRETQKLLEKN